MITRLKQRWAVHPLLAVFDVVIGFGVVLGLYIVIQYTITCGSFPWWRYDAWHFVLEGACP